MGKWELPPKGGHMDLADGVYFQNMSIKELGERLKTNDLIIIPLGSTENHGPAACVGEDTFIVTRLAELVAQKTRCTVAQPLWYGSHPYHHVGMPGTIVVPEDTFTGMLRAMMAGFWNTGFRKMIFLNGHGQEYVIPVAIHQFAKTYQVPAILINLNWYHAIPQLLKTKEEGGPFETPFIHADEVETSVCLNLFPEMIHMEDAVDTEPGGYLPEGHIDKAGNLWQRPINWYGQVGAGPIELAATPEGSVGKSTLARAEKAEPAMEALLDYMVKLHDDIMERFPPGKLPPVEEMTQRPKEEVEAVIKGALAKGGRSIYSLHYPP